MTVQEANPTAVEEFARKLMSLTPEEFRSEVDRDLRPLRAGDTTNKVYAVRRAALRTPTVVDRWFTTLSQIAKSVDGQLAAKTEDYEADRADLRAQILACTNSREEKVLKQALERRKSDYSRSRAGTLRFKSGLDEALIEARSLRDSVRDRLYDSVVAEERNRYAVRVTALEDAIREHRDALFAADMDPEDHDERLWSAVAKAEE